MEDVHFPKLNSPHTLCCRWAHGATYTGDPDKITCVACRRIHRAITDGRYDELEAEFGADNLIR